jgi:hypothetical protein
MNLSNSFSKEKNNNNNKKKKTTIKNIKKVELKFSNNINSCWEKNVVS